MRAASSRRSSKAEEEIDAVPSSDDDNAAGRRLGVEPRRRRSTGHPLRPGRADGTGRRGRDTDRVAPVRVSETLVIPDDELSWRFSRSSGPGGQGVNTTDSRVELSYDVT